MLSRRKFITGTSALLGSGVVGNSHGAESEFGPGPLAGRVKIAVKYQMVNEPELSAVEKFRLLQELGFDGTELRTADRKDSEEVMAAIEETGFPVHGIINSSDPDIIPAIDLAVRCKSDSVLVLAAEQKNMSYRENFAHWQKLIRAALPSAEKVDVKLCIENVRATFLKTGEAMAEFIDSFDSPAVRSYFDLGNTITWTEQLAEHWAEVLGKRVYKLDIKDRGHPEFGDARLKREGIKGGTDGGEVNWAGVREILVANGFSGWATAEVAGGNRDRLAGIARWMRDVLDLGER